MTLRPHNPLNFKGLIFVVPRLLLRSRRIRMDRPTFNTLLRARWVSSLHEWTREVPLLQIGPNDRKRSGGPFAVKFGVLRLHAAWTGILCYSDFLEILPISSPTLF
jgi:hypothetical protein